MRLTDVDLSNEPMRRMSEEVAMVCTRKMTDVVTSKFGLQTTPRANSTLSPKCLHDCIEVPGTKETFEAHLFADCAGLCHDLADAVAKNNHADREPEMYTVLAANTEKEMKKTEKTVKKAKNLVHKAVSKLATAVKQSREAAVAEATHTLDNAKKAFLAAESAHEHAQAKFKHFNERAAESMRLYSKIALCWNDALEAIADPALDGTPDYIHSCRLMILPQSSKRGGQHQCSSLNI